MCARESRTLRVRRDCVWPEELVIHGLLSSVLAITGGKFYLFLSIMSVSLKVLLSSRLLIITLDRRSLGRIQDKGTAFFIWVLDTFNIILNVFL